MRHWDGACRIERGHGFRAPAREEGSLSTIFEPELDQDENLHTLGLKGPDDEDDLDDDEDLDDDDEDLDDDDDDDDLDDDDLDDLDDDDLDDEDDEDEED